MPDANLIRQRVEKHYNQRKEFIIHLIVFGIINGALWAIWALTRGLLGFPWALVVTLGWGSGLAAHFLEARSWSPGHLAAVDRAIDRQMNSIYGPDWRDDTEPEDYARVSAAVTKQFRQNNEFTIHLTIYVIINLLLVMLWFILSGGVGFPIPLVLMALWGAGLAAHGASNYFDSSRSVAARERAVQRALAAEYVTKKKKRQAEPHTISTPDGEQFEVIEDDWEKENRLTDAK
ncbi:MAG: 2TM domain-containing protein [Anaerolineae bacterium]|nr:2TM domain-containing protein [Anaerolineae bacterium]